MYVHNDVEYELSFGIVVTSLIRHRCAYSVFGLCCFLLLRGDQHLRVPAALPARALVVKITDLEASISSAVHAERGLFNLSTPARDNLKASWFLRHDGVSFFLFIGCPDNEQADCISSHELAKYCNSVVNANSAFPPRNPQMPNLNSQLSKTKK